MTEKLTEKTLLRKRIREQRAVIPPYRQHLASLSLARRVLHSVSRLRHSRKIAFYLPQEGEISLLPLLALCLLSKRECFLPVLMNTSGKQLGFARWIPGSPMSVNRFGIAEPYVSQRELLSAADMDLIFMPLVAFDAHGHRLGMGGGYYDRSLAACFSGLPGHRGTPYLVAAAHDIQLVPDIPVEPWDIIPDVTITPARIIRPEKTRRAVNA
jgi:5-formyltetrahydrofolate cyclo-ligase